MMFSNLSETRACSFLFLGNPFPPTRTRRTLGLPVPPNTQSPVVVVVVVIILSRDLMVDSHVAALTTPSRPPAPDAPSARQRHPIPTPRVNPNPFKGAMQLLINRYG